MSDHQPNDFVTRGEFSKAIESISRKIDDIADKFSQRTTPNVANWSLCISVVLGLIYFLWQHELDAINKRFEIEVQARAQTFQQLNTRVERVENNQDEILKDESRRWKDSVGKTIKP